MSTMPRQLGKYQLQQQLGRGTVGEVWKGQDLQLRRDVAVKLIHTDLQTDPQFLTRFSQDGQMLTALHHTNIVPVREVNVSRSPQGNEMTAYLVMDYIEGQTLTDYLHLTSHRGDFPPIEQIIYLFTSLGVAVDAAHQRGIIHSNIKPGNILLNSRNTGHFAAGEPMLVDFGLNQLMENATIVGSPHYMSPEQARGEPANNRSDVYALGVLLYECCTGIQPFRDGSSVAVMMQHINTLPTPPILINPNIPPALSEVILRAMAKNTATRYAMASLLAAALADACSMQSNVPISLQSNQRDTGKLYQLPSAGNAQSSILGVSQPLSLQPPAPPQQPAASQITQSLPTFSERFSATFTGKHVTLSSPDLTSEINPAQGLQEEQNRLLSSDTKNSLPRISTPDIPGLPTFPSVSGPLPGMQISPSKDSASQRMLEQPTQIQRMLEQPTHRISLPLTYATAPAPPQAISATTAPPQDFHAHRRKNDRPIYITIASLLLLLIIVGGVIANLTGIFKGQPAAGTQSGQVFFQDDALGHNDVLRMDIKNVASPASGKTYFAWYQDTSKKIHPLGPLIISDGNATLLYGGDAKHTNLLPIVQDIFITAEDAGPQGASPTQARVYQAFFDPGTFPAIKRLLTQNATFPHDASVISGLFETIKSMNDKAGSIVDSLSNTGDTNLAKRQATRIIEMLDGTAYAQSSGDLPKQYPSQLPTKIGLLSTPQQPGYLDTLSKQLDQVASAAGGDQAILQHVQNTRYAIKDLQSWLQTIRSNDVQILKAANPKSATIVADALQIKQLAADAYTGHTIPPNASPLPIAGSAGAAQAYTECQYMATLELRPVHS
ncbi:MAG TPA: serine/threonine-protein kinase [Ktedonobacteraceae bacterium]|jgi:serine/threonine protein kinase|nr:serine/threonine-protein kinase [Ktedonobacteraceae bacterium]